MIADDFTITPRERAAFEEGFRIARTAAALTAEPVWGGTMTPEIVTARREIASDIRALMPPPKTVPPLEVDHGG